MGVRGASAFLAAEWARASGLDTELTNCLGMRLVLIPGGRFDMGPSGSTYRVNLTNLPADTIGFRVACRVERGKR
jgi:hypothetical protein